MKRFAVVCLLLLLAAIASPAIRNPQSKEEVNLLVNPTMTERDGERVRGWRFSSGDEKMCEPVQDGGRTVIRYNAPGRYANAQQSLRLKPNHLYRLEAQVKGDAAIYLRARTALKVGEQTLAYDVTVKPSANYRPYRVFFPTGPTGEALILLGATEQSGRGTAFIADLRVVEDMMVDADGPAIPVAADAAEPTVVTKIPVRDCRAVRGFIVSPVDGKTDSFNWDGRLWEYNMRGAGAGVGYSHRDNDGLHVTLADKRGVHAVLIRGGAQCKLYAGSGWERQDNDRLLRTFSGRAKTSRALFEKPVMTDRLSFFDLTNGLLADVSFFRVRQGLGDLPTPIRQSFSDVNAAAKVAVPLNVSLTDETPLAAVGLDLRVEGAASSAPFTVRVTDPLNPRSTLMEADFALSRSGRVRLVMDFPDQIVPAGTALSVSVSFDVPVRLVKPTVELYRAPRERALPEAIEYRKLMMKGLFTILSEPRPWNGWNRNTDVEQWFKTERLGPHVKELADTIAQCKSLAPNDDTMRQYDEWFWRRKRDLPPFTPKVVNVPGAPEWAVVARQAWLTAREVPRWWIENRMTPTGEFGGVVGDDSDMYQNFADFPMFETDSVAAMIKDGAARLAELAEAENLESGLNKRTMDPLHAYEEGVNQESLMMWWNYGDPVYFERCMIAARSLESLTVMTPQGHRHFKSQDCGAADLRMDRKTDVDGHAHPLMLHPACEVVWYNRNPRALKLLREWADGWLEHQTPGQYATSVEVATEKATEVSQRPLYGGYGGQASAFNFLYWITGDERYLRPFFDFWKEGRTVFNSDRFLPELLHRHKLPNVGDKLPAVVSGKGISETIATGNKAPLIAALKEDIAELQRFPAMYTTSEPFTDRVFLYAITNAAIAYTGGYATRNKYNHTHAVSWEGFGTDYAALVLRAHRDHFKVLLYNFADRPLNGRARLWTLEHGRYRLTFGADANNDDTPDRITREETVELQRATALPLTLPPKTVVVLELKQTEKLDDELNRADLALSPMEIKVQALTPDLSPKTSGEGNVVEGIVHNIGAKDVESVEVALVDANDQVQSRQTLGRLPAPSDLSPSRLTFRLSGLPRGAKGWKVVVDPQNKVEEIFEGNNAVEVR